MTAPRTARYKKSLALSASTAFYFAVVASQPLYAVKVGSFERTCYASNWLTGNTEQVQEFNAVGFAELQSMSTGIGSIFSPALRPCLAVILCNSAIKIGSLK